VTCQPGGCQLLFDPREFSVATRQGDVFALIEVRFDVELEGDSIFKCGDASDTNPTVLHMSQWPAIGI
jgi:hypothetical protein